MRSSVRKGIRKLMESGSLVEDQKARNIIWNVVKV
jgi:hypothetical protein